MAEGRRKEYTYNFAFCHIMRLVANVIGQFDRLLDDVRERFSGEPDNNMSHYGKLEMSVAILLRLITHSTGRSQEEGSLPQLLQTGMRFQRDVDIHRPRPPLVNEINGSPPTFK